MLRAQGLERVKGIEPSCAAWEAAVLPLNYTRAGGDIRPFGSPRQPPLLARRQGVCGTASPKNILWNHGISRLADAGGQAQIGASRKHRVGAVAEAGGLLRPAP